MGIHRPNLKQNIQPLISVINVIIQQFKNHIYNGTLNLYTKVSLMLVINVMSCIHMVIVSHEKTILHNHPTKIYMTITALTTSYL